MNTKDILKNFECVRGQWPQYMARCPAHNDRRPSLSIKETEDKTLIHCFAGCKAEEIMSKIGLELKDLYKNKNERN